MTVHLVSEPDVSLAAAIDCADAMRALNGRVIRTEVRRLHWLERWVGVPVWAKLECHQITGSFKYRGAWYRLGKLQSKHGIIAASAGNHGIAVAEVARRMNIRANICVPTTASRLKRERILATGQGLIEFGNSLEDATGHAIELAERRGWTFISPYNDPDIIAGQSTVGIELLQDAPDIDTMVVPVGGGGLACGIALGCKALGRKIRVIGVEPERYSSLSASMAHRTTHRVLHQPTIADGLAVNLEQDAITVNLALELIDQIVLLNEEEIAAATLSILFHEGLLVEPAGAASVLACIRLAERGLLTGPVGIPLCGGNLHHNTLSKIQHWPFSDPTCRRLLDLHGRSVEHEVPSRVFTAQIAPAVSGEAGSAADFLGHQFQHCLRQAAEIETKIDDYVAYGTTNKLAVPHDSVAFVRGILRDCRTLVERSSLRLALATADKAASDALALSEADLRTAMQGLATARGALEWRSAAYGQSRAMNFFELAAQDNPGVNYDRYEHGEVKRIEAQLLEQMNLPGDRFAVTVTSSGMAAYALIEAHLLRSRLGPGASIVTAPYVYFESAEQISSLPGLSIHPAAGYLVDDIVAATVVHRPTCLFVDPLVNNVDQRMVDIDELTVRLRHLSLAPMTLVIDGSMMSGTTGKTVLGSGDGIDVYYYESCSKYLQFGLDIVMAGAVVHSVEEKPRFDRLRRNLGLILYPTQALCFPQYSPGLYEERLRRIGRNAALVAHVLEADPIVSRLARVVHPALKSHPDHEIARKAGFGGGCVTFDFFRKGDGHRDQLNSLIEIALSEATGRGTSLVKGVSFGFTQPRISAAASMAEDDPPFLRLYAGDLSADQYQALCDGLSAAFAVWSAHQ
jgi:threonine dehydratase